MVLRAAEQRAVPGCCQVGSPKLCNHKQLHVLLCVLVCLLGMKLQLTS